jgi:hypothetical protein
MDDNSSISRLVPMESMLFRSLREKAIEELQKKAGLTWSDHNIHDPGITLLESFCYVITELGNLLNFSFGDLIATAKGIADAVINYPTAAINLPVSAVTILDYRKILLDLPEIRNAYFEITNESKIPVYYDPNPGPGLSPKLTYVQNSDVYPIQWGGLYSIQLEMEDDNLNANFLNDTIVVPVGVINKNVDIIISFKYWDEVTDEWFRSTNITSITLENTIVALDDTQYEDYYSEWTINFSDGSVVTNFPVWVKLVVPLAPGDPMIPNLLISLQSELSSTAAGSPFIKYKTNLMAVQVNVDKAKDTYLLNRNLGEDISYFTAVRLQEIAMNASVEISSAADPVEIYALIIFAIESFFSPAPSFKSLQDLLDASDFKVENVFLGPLLNSGFLSEDDLNTLSRGNVIYVSDLVHLIMDINDIVTVRDISLNTFFNNFQAIVDERNCLKIKSGYKPKLGITRSNLVLTRQGIPVAIDMSQVDARLAVLRANALALPGPGIKDLEVPFGNLPEIGDYRSVQFELPGIYGTGAAGIPVSSPPERIAQLKQLQGYLFLFDQIIANTYAQLANIGDYFAVHQQLSKSYYYKLLYNVPGAEDLIGYLGAPGTWNDFISLPENEYTKLLDEAGEPGDTYFKRRDALLDYLLARTAENRKDYAALLSALPGNFSKDIILHHKENFLERYPLLSQSRAQAYDYLLNTGGVPDVWDSGNIGGYAKMLCAKLGFSFCRKHTIFHLISENFEFFSIFIPIVSRRYKLKDNGGNDLMVCENHFADDTAATESLKVFLDVGRYRENYEIIALPGGTFTFKITLAPVDMIYNGLIVLNSLADAENAIRLVINIIGEKYSLEGLHIVEHILLRPRIKGATEADSDKLFKLLKAEETLLTDPYSHVVTVILPSGMERNFSVVNDVAVPSITGNRMRDPAYRLFAQQTILREAPAHLLVNIFFLDIDTDPGGALIVDRPSMQNFERTCKAWSEALADAAATPLVKRTTQQQFVTVIENIYGA